MTRSIEGEQAPTLHRNGFKLLSIAGGAAVGVLLVALDRVGADTPTERQWLDSAPAVLPAPGSAAPQRVAALDEGVDWHRVEVWNEYGSAAVAAYER